MLASRVEEISTLPHVALRVMETASDPDAGAGDLKAALESDPALSARVLRCVNSSAYALRTKVSNLQLAIAYLGFKQIRNLAVTATVGNLFKNNEALGTYRRAELWRHMVAVGVGARLIALRQKLATFEDAFLAGLLHDIGLVIEDQCLHAEFRQAMLRLSANKTLVETEREVLGLDHAVLGACLGERWKFPEPVQVAIRFHHSADEYQGEHARILRCVELANLICAIKGMTSVGMNLLSASRGCMAGLSLTRHDLEVLIVDFDRELFLHNNLFTL